MSESASPKSLPIYWQALKMEELSSEKHKRIRQAEIDYFKRRFNAAVSETPDDYEFKQYSRDIEYMGSWDKYYVPPKSGKVPTEFNNYHMVKGYGNHTRVEFVYSVTDPDWAFDVKKFTITLLFPQAYPIQKPVIENVISRLGHWISHSIGYDIDYALQDHYSSFKAKEEYSNIGRWLITYLDKKMYDIVRARIASDPRVMPFSKAYQLYYELKKGKSIEWHVSKSDQREEEKREIESKIIYPERRRSQ